MLSKTHKLAFRILNLAFSYMSPSPIIWDTEYQNLKYNKCKKSCRIFLYFLVLHILCAFGFVYSLVTHFLVERRENYNIGVIGMHILGAPLVLIPIAVFVIILRHPETLSGFNALFALKNRSGSWLHIMVQWRYQNTHYVKKGIHNI